MTGFFTYQYSYILVTIWTNRQEWKELC